MWHHTSLSAVNSKSQKPGDECWDNTNTYYRLYSNFASFLTNVLFMIQDPTLHLVSCPLSLLNPSFVFFHNPDTFEDWRLLTVQLFHNVWCFITRDWGYILLLQVICHRPEFNMPFLVTHTKELMVIQYYWCY